MARYRVKPSKSASALGMVVGAVFVGIGLFVAIPTAGAFGVFWTLVAVAITGYHAVNVFSDKGVAVSEVVADHDPPAAEPLPPDERLRRLEKLRADGLLTDDEYARKRAELLGEKW